MFSTILRSHEPLGLVGGGPVEPALIVELAGYCPQMVAADAGAVPLLEAGFQPAAVIGDFDSLPEAARQRLDPALLHHVAEQNSTDFEKVLARVAAPLVLGAGFLGARLDHQLAALSALVGLRHRACALISAREVVFHCPPDLRLDLPADMVVSLFPMLPVSGCSEGLRWPIDGLSLAPGARVGTSNRALGAVRIRPEGPGLIVILPREALPQAMAVLRRPGPDDPPWPVP